MPPDSPAALTQQGQAAASSPETHTLTLATEKAPGAPSSTANGYQVKTEGYTGPFDLLLQLIARRQLDVTELALAEITDDFIAHLRQEDGWDLSRASEFLVIAATLLDIKAARLLPQTEALTDEDLEVLEARDLLLARLLQYRAYKEVSESFATRYATEGRRQPRTVALENHFAALLPELIWRTTPEELAQIAAGVFSRKRLPDEVQVTHLHDPVVPIAGQARIISSILRKVGAATFRELAVSAPTVAHVVSRFLAVLEMYRQNLVALDQRQALGELTITWTAPEGADIDENLLAATMEEDMSDDAATQSAPENPVKE